MRYVALRGKTLRVRIPLIPGFNDDESTIRHMLDILEGVPTLHHIDLIPYHTLGVGKYEGLGRPYHLKGVQTLSQEHVDYVKSIIESHGYSVSIGG